MTELTVFGLGYHEGSGLTVKHPRIYDKWRKLLEKVTDRSKGYYNTIDISDSWCCFENFLAWYLKCEAALETEKSCFVVFNAPELLVEKRRRVDGKMVALISPKYSAKTCHLSIVRPAVWRGSRQSTKLVYDKDVKEHHVEAHFLPGTTQAMKVFYPLPAGTKLHAKKKAALRRYAEQGRCKDARSEQLRQERQATKLRVEARRNAKDPEARERWPGYAKRYNDIIQPAQMLQLRQIDNAPGEEKIRRAKAKTPEEAVKQAGVFRGLGYIGVGKYPTKKNGKDTRAFKTWMELLKRCYLDCANRDDRDCMRGYRLGKRFLNFQKFAKWFEENDRFPDARNLPAFEPEINAKGFLVLGPKNLRLAY